MSDHLYMKNNSLLDAAKSIFGDELIEYAYVSVNDCYKDELIMCSLESFDDNESIPLDSEPDIIIKFSSGKLVLFTISEWGEIADITNNKNFSEIV